MSNKTEKTEMTSISIDDLDVSELETRIELATSSTQCDCSGACTGKCDTFHVQGGGGAAGTSMAPGC